MALEPAQLVDVVPLELLIQPVILLECVLAILDTKEPNVMNVPAPIMTYLAFVQLVNVLLLEVPHWIVIQLVCVLANLDLLVTSVKLVTLPMVTLELLAMNAYQIGTLKMVPVHLAVVMLLELLVPLVMQLDNVLAVLDMQHWIVVNVPLLTMTYQVSVPVVNVMHQAVMVQIVQIPQVLVLAIQDTWETNVIAVPQIIMSLLIKSVQCVPLVGFSMKELATKSLESKRHLKMPKLLVWQKQLQLPSCLNQEVRLRIKPFLTS